jgi:hypothetical protein
MRDERGGEKEREGKGREEIKEEGEWVNGSKANKYHNISHHLGGANLKNTRLVEWPYNTFGYSQNLFDILYI